MSDFKNKIKHLREDFNRDKIDFKNLPVHPLSLFDKWIEQALNENKEANAFVLSTVSDKNIPSSRVLLLRDFDKNGFTFFTNYNSIKANDIKNNNNVTLNFYWSEFQRQVRIIGKAEKISDLDSDKYFSSRPRESQLGAWVSEQSAVIPLDTAFANKMEKMKSKLILFFCEKFSLTLISFTIKSFLSEELRISLSIVINNVIAPLSLNILFS